MNNNKRIIIPKVVSGGKAIPIGNNFYYMKGRKHSQGGIDIGENAKTGLEVEGGEIIQMTPNNLKVFSSVPFLKGESPAEKILKGENPNKVFNQQESFKDRNNLNDDGTKAELGKKEEINEDPLYNVILPGVNITAKAPKFDKKIAKTMAKQLSKKEIDNSFIPQRYKSYVKGEVEGAIPMSNYLNKVGNKIGPYALGVLSNLPILEGASLISSTGKILNKGSKYLTPGYWLTKAGKPIAGIIADATDAAIGTSQGITTTVKNIKEKDYKKAAFNGVLATTGLSSLKTLSKIINPKYRAYHAYHTIKPFGYNNPLKRGKEFLSSMITNKKYNKDLKLNFDFKNEDLIPNELFNKAREDAWAIYLGQSPKNNIYIKNLDGTYSYNLNTIKKLNPKFHPILTPINGGNGYDYVTGAGGGLTKNILNEQNKNIGTDIITQGTQHIEDLWDLHPFSRQGDELNNRYNSWYNENISNKIQNFRKKLYNKNIIGIDANYLGNKIIEKLENKTLNRLRNNPPFINSINNLNNKFKNFEVGPLLGGKPFLMKTDIPYFYSTIDEINNTFNRISNIDSTPYVKLNINDKAYKDYLSDKGINYIKEYKDFNNDDMVNNMLNTILLKTNKKALGGEKEGMTGMMKAKLAIADHFKNPTARRITYRDTREYKFPDGRKGNVLLSSYDNYVIPHIQDVNGKLTYINNPWDKENYKRSEQQSIKFDRPEDAIYFGEHYKEIAPMMKRNWKKLGGIKNINAIKNKTMKYIFNINGKDNLRYIPNNRKKAELGVLERLTEPGLNKLSVNMDNMKIPTTTINTPKVTAPTNKSSKFKEWLTDNKNDIISSGATTLSNIGSAIAGYAINNKMLNNLEFAPAPISQQATKLKTNYNINPQLDSVRESLGETEKNITNNTASSKVALNRILKARANATQMKNQLYGQKENIETQLINKDKLNQQEIANKNIENYNDYLQDKNQFERDILDKKSENAISLVDNINQSFQNLFTNIDKNKNFRNTLMAQLAAAPNVNPEMLKAFGLPITNKMIEDYNKGFNQ